MHSALFLYLDEPSPLGKIFASKLDRSVIKTRILGAIF